MAYPFNPNIEKYLAIQFERDSIGSPKKRRDSPPLSQSGNVISPPDVCTDVIDNLMEMEARVNQEMSTRYRNSVITSNGAAANIGGAFQPTGADPGPSSAFTQPVRPCTVDDLNEISRTTLLLMVEWAKNLAPFPDLSMEDKIILLKNYAPQHLILMPAFRSPDSEISKSL